MKLLQNCTRKTTESLLAQRDKPYSKVSAMERRATKVYRETATPNRNTNVGWPRRFVVTSRVMLGNGSEFLITFWRPAHSAVSFAETATKFACELRYSLTDLALGFIGTAVKPN